MRRACSSMMPRKRSRASGIGPLRRALQRLDEAEQRGERRAQFMAGVGDEIDPHLFEPPHFGRVMQGQGDEPRRARMEGRDMNLEQPFDRHAVEPGHVLGPTGGHHPGDGVVEIDRPQARGQRRHQAKMREQARAREHWRRRAAPTRRPPAPAPAWRRSNWRQAPPTASIVSFMPAYVKQIRRRSSLSACARFIASRRASQRRPPSLAPRSARANTKGMT